MKVKLAISIVLALLAFIFISQNTETVRVDFLVWSTEMSVVLLVFIILGTGVIIGWSLSGYLRFVRNRKQVKSREAMQAKVVASQEAADAARQENQETHK
ncbi:MAG: LapA family protein [Desulfuromonadales bacterium]